MNPILAALLILAALALGAMIEHSRVDKRSYDQGWRDAVSHGCVDDDVYQRGVRDGRAHADTVIKMQDAHIETLLRLRKEAR